MSTSRFILARISASAITSMGQSCRVPRLVRRVVAVRASRAHLGPLLRRLVVTFFVLQELLRDAPDERIVRIRIRQQRADGEQDLGDGERGRPLLLQDVQANLPRAVHVTVIDSRSKRNFRRFERVIRRKLNVKKKYTILIGRSCARYRDAHRPIGQRSVLNLRGRAPRLASPRVSPLRTARTDDGRHPFVQIITLRSRAAIRRRFQRNLRQLLLDASRAARQRTLLLTHRRCVSVRPRSLARWRAFSRSCLCASIDRSIVDLSSSSRPVASRRLASRRTLTTDDGRDASR
jgi:hypothetical protein